MDIIAQKSLEVTTALMRQKDVLIKRAIDHRLGEDWTVEEVTGRGCMVITPDKIETFEFDGVPLIEFLPFDSTMHDNIIQVSIKYRLLY